MTIHAVLLIPGPGHEKLLEGGKCGSRPPIVMRGDVCGVEAHRRWETPDDFADHASCYMCGGPQRALALAWEGEPVPEGMDRAWRAVAVGGYPYSNIQMRHVLTVAPRDLAALGTIVLLDENGREAAR